ncbi:hypothetical protein ACCO45_005678 [Purpureocillium lilacinum]|uniref:Uncharacterized protein n=1 Tax=Purpureocillium lilacinum TaxID=33203 RepID=A0ACC4DWD3_PURLI
MHTRFGVVVWLLWLGTHTCLWLEFIVLAKPAKPFLLKALSLTLHPPTSRAAPWQPSDATPEPLAGPQFDSSPSPRHRMNVYGELCIMMDSWSPRGMPPPPDSETGGCMQRFDDGCNNMRTPLAHSPEGCRGSTNLLVSVIAHKDPLAARAFETTPEGHDHTTKGARDRVRTGG